MSFICPLCQTLLNQRKIHFCCPGGHHFDKAKEGYVNLLPVQHKCSRSPGDRSEMMKARRKFLDAGHYLRLRECIVQKLQYHLPSSCEAMLDIGCGKGYYTQAFGKEVKARGGITMDLMFLGGGYSLCSET